MITMIGATRVLVGQDLIIVISRLKFLDFVEKCVDYAVSRYWGVCVCVCVWGGGGVRGA